MKRYRDWCIQCKIVSITLLTMLLLISALFGYILPMFRDNLMTEKELATRHIVELAMGVLEQYDAAAKSGKLPLEQAQQEATEQIARLRYEGKEYLWINDLGKPAPRMIMHPTVPALNGKVLDDTKFNKATLMQDAADGPTKKLDNMNLFSAFVEVADRAGHGFVMYQWPKPKQGGGTTEELYPKLSYVKKFAPWGWVLGSGIYVDDVDKQAARVMWTLLAGTLLLAACGIAIAVAIGRGVVRPMNTMQQALEQMASGEGDLTRRLPIQREDETGVLARTFNRFLENLHNIIRDVSQGTQELNSAADRLHATAEHIADSSLEMSSQSVSVATAVEEMAATSQSIAQSCAQAYENANRACLTAQDGSAVVSQAVASIRAIADRVQESSHTVETLGARSDQIGQIIGTIEDIADQTNLLALNAAIEAARAGEMGRGFAVVADEVRALAERTTRATREIGEMIKVIQQETATAVASMGAGVQAVEQGTIEAAKSGQALEEILAQISEVTSQINQIATAAEEQTATTNDISGNMQRIVSAVDTSTAQAHATGQEATELANMSGNLANLVGRFRV
ncbi:methyl-accepting chemotaxis protein [Trichlorobacter lovleyi]|uniref:Methyl-accepting chemotaxis sensory transducer n=1 Tax=Trichlorobacter lovleyi (strain ATCC BAA-1151 / DSM 17278 / SZ) TaxID=398767 RepID=B3E2D6_TRIL1|nr:methyl-accepting chemotaxis protein [Trichlorobacter lovleyi]ACD94189.1 methyl-accepting chemotaxis sensory transducer [Trichlorobacter lovleyi SZ]